MSPTYARHRRNVRNSWSHTAHNKSGSVTPISWRCSASSSSSRTSSSSISTKRHYSCRFLRLSHREHRATAGRSPSVRLPHPASQTLVLVGLDMSNISPSDLARTATPNPRRRAWMHANLYAWQVCPAHPVAHPSSGWQPGLRGQRTITVLCRCTMQACMAACRRRGATRMQAACLGSGPS